MVNATHLPFFSQAYLLTLAMHDGFEGLAVTRSFTVQMPGKWYVAGETASWLKTLQSNLLYSRQACASQSVHWAQAP